MPDEPSRLTVCVASMDPSSDEVMVLEEVFPTRQAATEEALDIFRNGRAKVYLSDTDTTNYFPMHRILEVYVGPAD